MTITRYFTNNSKYGDFNLLHFDSLAFMVQEFLFTEKTKNARVNYCMEGRIKLYDFMSMSVYFISPAYSEFGKASIKEYILEMQRYPSSYGTDRIEYSNRCFCISNASNAMVVALLWTAYIFFRANHELCHKEEYAQACDLLYGLLQDKLGNTKGRSGKQHLLFKLSDEAVELMIKHVKKKVDRQKVKTATDNDSQEGDAKYQEMEAENQELKKRCKELQQLLEESESLQEIEWSDKVRLELLLRLLKKDGADMDKYGNRIKAASVMQTITGLPISTCKNYCTNRDLSHTHHEEEILKLNSILQALGMGTRL